VAEINTFYKYKSFDEANFAHIQDIFVNNRIYFPSPVEFNDPFDGSYQYSLEGSEEEKVKFFIRVLKNNKPDLSPAERIEKANQIVHSAAFQNIDPAVTNRTIKNLGIYCLSLVRDDILMWSHYSQKHTGIVLEFKPGSFFAEAFEVNYQEKYPNIRIYDDDLARMKAGILTKSTHWAYEKEYRVIEYTKGPGVYDFSGNLLTGVIFGCRMPEERKIQIRDWISKRHFKPAIYQASLKKREYGLNIELVN
jgi:hypothetical protein